MKINKFNNATLKGFAYIGLILTLAFFILTGFQPEKQILNPYDQVNWSKYGQYKANLNTQTMISNGWENPQSVVEKYRKLDYRILAITDPGIVTYPWEDFSKFRTSENTFSRIYHLVVRPFQDHSIPLEDTLFTDVSASDVGMTAVQGCKLTYDKHDINSYFNNDNHSEGDIFKAVAAKNGIMVINHPGKNAYPVKWYVDLFRSNKHLAGIEVFSSAGFCQDIRCKWDSILTVMLPGRPVWGFANDNFLSLRDLGENWNIFILPELNEQEVRKAMEKGVSLMVHAPLGYKGPTPPEIKSVKVNQKKGTIEIDAIGSDSVLWVSEGVEVGRGSQLQLITLPEQCKYVRAEIHGAGNTVVCTQPFVIR